VSKKFKFTQDNLDEMIIKELDVTAESEQPNQVKQGKPNLIEKLLSRKQIQGQSNEQ